MPVPEPMTVKTGINRVTNMPFKWSLNPYRGCEHACLYCYARVTHEYLGLDSGREFDEHVLYKENIVQVVTRQLQSARWHGEPVAIGTATDCYQPLEGRLKLTRQLLATMLANHNPVSITTKSPLVLRDLDLLRQLAEGPGVVVHLSVATLDESAWRFLEPGTPHPRYRLRALATLRASGIRAGVLMAPIVPGLTDSPAQLEAVVREAAAAQAAFVVPIVLRLQHGAREWFLEHLQRQHPELLARFAALYRGDYAPEAYTQPVTNLVGRLRQKYGIANHEDHGPKTMPAPNHRWDVHPGTYPTARRRDLVQMELEL